MVFQDAGLNRVVIWTNCYYCLTLDLLVSPDEDNYKYLVPDGVILL